MPSKPTNHRPITQHGHGPKGDKRLKLEAFLLKNPGRHSVATLAAAMGVSEPTARSTIGVAVNYGVCVNTNPGVIPAMYQHREHWKREQMVSRRDPITNAGMPNGSQAWWAGYMARFNAPPRVA